VPRHFLKYDFGDSFGTTSPAGHGNGGPLWEPLCYAQFRGLTIATIVTLLMVPVMYSIAVFDLKIVR